GAASPSGAEGNTNSGNRGAPGVGGGRRFGAQAVAIEASTMAASRRILRADTRAFPAEAREETPRDLGFDGDVPVRHRMRQNTAEAIELRDLIAAALVLRVELECDFRGVERETGFHRRNQFIAAVAGERGDAQRARADHGQALALAGIETVTFVEDVERRHAVRPDRLENRPHRL